MKDSGKSGEPLQECLSHAWIRVLQRIDQSLGRIVFKLTLTVMFKLRETSEIRKNISMEVGHAAAVPRMVMSASANFR